MCVLSLVCGECSAVFKPRCELVGSRPAGHSATKAPRVHGPGHQMLKTFTPAPLKVFHEEQNLKLNTKAGAHGGNLERASVSVRLSLSPQHTIVDSR